ncbi:MAG: MCP four helix bundle domain-containing protein [Pelomonas sp.]|nr:MCP four helix bundle domain-containing protein [Roseateles sp.]
MLNNLKIGVRLGAAFAVVLALTLLLGGFSLRSLGVVNAATDDLATNWLPGTRFLGAFATALNAERRAEAVIAVSDDAATLEAQTSSRQTQQRRADAAWESYAKTISSPDERVLADAIVAALKAYREQAERCVATARGGDHPGAYKIYNVEGRAAFTALSDATQKDIDFQTEGADKAYAASQAEFTGTRRIVVALLVVSTGLGAALAFVITRSITTPIQQAVWLARTVADGDLSVQVRSDRKDETGALLGALGEMNERLAGIVGDVRLVSDSIATGSSEIASGNQDLSQRTEEQASNLEQTAAAMEELSSTVRNNADAAQQARQIAQNAAQAAERGGAVVQEVVTTMADISTSSRKIADIIGVIDGIAFQTNILALNAAVEAARAGEQGRGFAVVAGEVRSLAQRSAAAAKEIKGLINASAERVEAGTTLVGNAGAAIGDVVLQVQRVNDLVGEISAASVEQSKGIGQVGEAVTQLDQVTQQNAALVEQSAAAAESLKHQAGRLAQAMAVFKLARATAPAPAAAPRPAAPRPAAAPRAAVAPRPAAPRPAPAATAAAAPTPTPARSTARPQGESDWETF